MPTRTPDFDEQAPDFDTRAGLPPGTAARVADAIVAIAPLVAGARVLDIGAGTGEIGQELLAKGIHYTALDASPEMLGVFRRRAHAAGLVPELLVGDACEPWPVRDAAVGLVFGSRSMHWLTPDHVRNEALRVAAPSGCAVLIGRVVRPDANPRARLRRKMRELLREAGYAGRSGDASTRAIVQSLVAGGATPVPAHVAAVWTVHVTPRSVLEDWRNKSGLGGADVPPSSKDEVLAQTEAWAIATFDDIDVPIDGEECYTLEGAMLPLAGSPIR